MRSVLAGARSNPLRSATSVETLARLASAACSASDLVMAAEMSTASTEDTFGARAVVTNPVPAPRSTHASDGRGAAISSSPASTFSNAAAEVT